jgi:hypothetical protein
MFVVLCLKLIFFSEVNAKSLNVSYKNYHYQLNFDSKRLVFKDSVTELTIDSKKCNEHILKHSERLIENYLSHTFIYSQSPENLKIDLDQKVFYESRNTVRGNFLIKLGDFIKSKKIEEELNCSK